MMPLPAGRKVSLEGIPWQIHLPKALLPRTSLLLLTESESQAEPSISVCWECIHVVFCWLIRCCFPPMEGGQLPAQLGTLSDFLRSAWVMGNRWVFIKTRATLHVGKGFYMAYIIRHGRFCQNFLGKLNACKRFLFGEGPQIKSISIR